MRLILILTFTVLLSACQISGCATSNDTSANIMANILTMQF